MRKTITRENNSIGEACAYCGVQFQLTRSYAKFCSESCKQQTYIQSKYSALANSATQSSFVSSEPRVRKKKVNKLQDFVPIILKTNSTSSPTPEYSPAIELIFPNRTRLNFHQSVKYSFLLDVLQKTQRIPR